MDTRIATGTPQRFEALDVFRGLTLAGMIIVNTPGHSESAFRFLEHAAWHGWTAADLVFPWFVFIMGVAMPFSLGRRGAHGAAVYRHIVRRTLILFALGLVLCYNPERDLAHWRIMGVLQRIALVYFTGSVIFLNTKRTGQFTAAALLLAGYWLLMTRVPAPGAGAGDLSRFGNLAGYMDRLVMANHLYKPGWDPEGLLHTLPAVATLLSGCLAGHWLRTGKPMRTKILGMAGAGCALTAAAYALNPWFPINKNLWSPPYVLLTAGLALLVLAACIHGIDVRGAKRWTAPFLVVGKNSIVTYVVSILLMIPLYLVTVQETDLRTWLFLHWFAPWLPPAMASLAFSLAYCTLIILLMTPLYLRGKFIKI
jgi:predicted acyltransferase